MINIKESLKGIIIVGLYFLSPTVFIMPFIIALFPNISKGYLYLTVYIILALIFSIIYFKDLIHDFKDFKKKYKKYLKIAFTYWIKGLFIMLSCSLLFSIFKLDNNLNQSANEELLKNFPIIEIIMSTLLAPIIEELVFRRSLKDISSNIHIFSYISGTIFALLHLVTSLNNPIMIIYLIPYAAIGISFAYSYKKTNNIFTSMTIHSLHNAIALLQLILLGGL